MPTVVVVPTYHESAIITALLDALIALPASDQGDDRLEVLVVDDNSPDGTADVVRDHAARVTSGAATRRPPFVRR